LGNPEPSVFIRKGLNKIRSVKFGNSSSKL